MPIARSLRRPQWSTIGFVVCYLLAAYLVLLPVLTTPVVADDFINPFIQIRDGGAGVLAGVDYGWEGATEGTSFRILGNPIGGAYNALWISTSAHFGIEMSTLYAITKFVVLLAAAASAALFWHRVTRQLGWRTTYRSSLVLVSAAMFLTIQVHAYWSNDPVASYPLSGYGSAVFAFLALAAAVEFALRPTLRRAGLCLLANVAAVLYYEMNIGAVLGAFVIMVGGLIPLIRARTWAPTLRYVASGGLALAVPAGFIVAGRFVTGDHAGSYGGTTIRFGHQALRTFGLHALSSLPGGAWTLSQRILGGSIAVVFFVVPVLVVLVVLGREFARRSLRAGEPADAPVRWVALVAPLAALAIYWAFPLFIQAITVKVQDETLGLGYVYTSYSAAASAVACVIAGLVWVAVHRLRAGHVRAALTVVVVSAVAIQLTVNWRLNEQLNRDLVPNRRLIDAFDDETPPPLRCQALADWSAGNWPSYYEDGMIDGLQLAYDEYFGEPFCQDFSTAR